MVQLIRLDKYLAGAGFGSRKEVKKLVKSGVVSVNDKIAKDSSAKISIDSIVKVDGDSAVFKEFYYVMMNKPAGYISSTVPSGNDPPVTDLLPEELQYIGLAPVGRLDKDTTGLLLLTNDGVFSHRMIAPRRNVIKTYYAIIEGGFDYTVSEAFRVGMTLDDGDLLKPANVEKLVDYIERSGKPEIKRICRAGSTFESIQEGLSEKVLGEENLTHENLTHENLTHENLTHENLTQENLSQENLSENASPDENLSDESLSDEGLSKGVSPEEGFDVESLEGKSLFEQGLLEKGLEEVIVEVTEGKYHQVKRMFAACGRRVVFLRRICFGKYWLPETLAEGETIEISVE